MTIEEIVECLAEYLIVEDGMNTTQATRWAIEIVSDYFTDYLTEDDIKHLRSLQLSEED